MTDYTRKQHDLPSNNRLKQIKVGWLARIEVLWELIASCKRIEEKRSDAFLRSLEIVKELEGPPLIRESTMLTKEQLESELNILKISWGSEFDISLVS
jgi:hypothetical protein